MIEFKYNTVLENISTSLLSILQLYSHTSALSIYLSEPPLRKTPESSSTSSKRQTFLDPHDVLMSGQIQQNHLSTREIVIP